MTIIDTDTGEIIEALSHLPGIYRIVNIANGKCYVGQTRDLRDRKRRHFTSLASNKHPNSHLQAAYNQHGKASFEYEVLEVVNFPADFQDNPRGYREYLKPYEQKWIDAYKSADRQYGYNLAPSAGTNLGVVRSDETKRLLSAINTGRKLSEETRQKLRASSPHRKPSLEARIKMSIERSVNQYIVTTPEGDEFVIDNLKQFCRENGLSRGLMSAVLHGRQSHHHGYKVRFSTMLSADE